MNQTSTYKIQRKIHKKKLRKSYAMGDGAGGHVVEGTRQPALSHRHGDVRQRGGNRRWRYARLLTAGLHGLPHFLEESRGPIVNDVCHDRKEKKERKNQTEKERKMSKSKEKCEKEKQKSR